MLQTEQFLWNNKHKNKILLTGNRQSWRRGIPPSVSLPGTGQIQNYVRVQCWPMRYQRKEGKKKRKKAGELPTTAQRCCYDTTKNKRAQSDEEVLNWTCDWRLDCPQQRDVMCIWRQGSFFASTTRGENKTETAAAAVTPVYRSWRFFKISLWKKKMDTR